MAEPNNLPRPVRFITGHNNEGLSIIESTRSESLPVRTQDDGFAITFCYATQGFPVQLANDQDLSTYDMFKENPPGIVVPNGSAARLVDIPPGYTSAMHRSISVNYNVVIEGEVHIIMDSGEKRLLKRGDSVVQRAVNHAWANASNTQWARITAVSFPAEVPATDSTMVKHAAHS